MTVRELMEYLAKQNPDANVAITTHMLGRIKRDHPVNEVSAMTNGSLVCIGFVEGL